MVAELSFKKVIFIGAVGALKKGYELKKASVFEMETSSFYLMTELLEVPGIALLVVSDNSATGAALVGRTKEEQEKYDKGRNVILPDMVMALAEK